MRHLSLIRSAKDVKLRFVLVFLLGSCCFSATTKPTPTTQSAQMEAELVKLLGQMQSDQVLRSEVASLNSVAGVLHWVDRNNDLGAVAEIGKLLDDAVKQSGHDVPPGTKDPSVVALAEHRVFHLTRDIPGAAVNAQEEKAPGRIHLWICSDRETASAVYWLRAGRRRQIPNGKSETTATDSRFQECSDEEKIGARCYEFYPDLMYSVLLPKSDPRHGGHRIGFLRDNVLAEVEAWSYEKDSSGNWKCIGMSRSDKKEAMTILRVLDSHLVRNEESHGH